MNVYVWMISGHGKLNSDMVCDLLRLCLAPVVRLQVEAKVATGSNKASVEVRGRRRWTDNR